MKSNYTLFAVTDGYGQYRRQYCFDTVLGRPYLKEDEYEMRFAGWGDHIGTPGPKLSSETRVISFSELRAAAKQSGETRYYEIDETNWREILAGLW